MNECYQSARKVPQHNLFIQKKKKSTAKGKGEQKK